MLSSFRDARSGEASEAVEVGEDEARICFLLIEGMTCDSCVYTITTKVGKQPGILKAEVDLESKIGKALPVSTT